MKLETGVIAGSLRSLFGKDVLVEEKSPRTPVPVIFRARFLVCSSSILLYLTGSAIREDDELAE